MRNQQVPSKICHTYAKHMSKPWLSTLLLGYFLFCVWVQNIPDSSKTVPIVQTVSKLSVYFRMTSKSSRWFHNCLDISRWSQNLPDGFITVRKFPDNNITVPIFLEGLKTFWVFSIYYRMSSKSSRGFKIDPIFPDDLKTTYVDGLVCLNGSDDNEAHNHLVISD